MNKKIFRCTLESIIYSSIIYYLFYFLPSVKHNFLSMNLHPLIIVVAYISLKYGVYIGVIGSLIATITYISVYISLGNDIVLFFLNFQYYKFFLMFLFINIVLGKVKISFDEREEKLLKEKEIIQNRYKVERDKNFDLVTINAKLKNQIVTGRESLFTLHEMKVSLKNKRLEEIYTEILLILKKFLHCEKGSIYRIVDDKIVLQMCIGQNDLVEKDLKFDIEKDSPFDKVLNSKEAMSFPLNPNKTSPIYLSPIFARDKIIGFLSVEKIRFSSQEIYSFELFKIITFELNDAISFILEEVDKKKSFYESAPNVTKWEEFEYLVKENEKRKKLLDYNFMLFEGKNPNYSFDDVSKILIEKNYTNNFVTMNEKSIRILVEMVEEKKKNEIKEKIREVFKEVDFYEI